MSISSPPAAPSRNDPASFSPRMDAFLAWLVTAVPQFNDLAILADGGTYFVTSNTLDATPGRLIKVGDFGIGGVLEPPGNDLNGIAIAGEYFADGATANRPTGAGNWLIRHGRRSLNEYVQIAYPRTAAVRGVHFRFCASGVWSAWQRVFQQDNIIGTVSQASGVPTGAIIESGSNANGLYTRFADGTQICVMESAMSQSIAATTYAEITWTYPAAFASGTSYSPFVNTRSLNDAPGRQNAARFLRAVGGGIGASSGAIGCFNAHTSALNARIDGLVIGRWFI